MPAMLIAYSSPAGAGREDAFLQWYREVHAPELRHAIPEITEFSQYKLARPGGATPRYVARYEAPGLDAAAFAARLSAANGTLTMTDAMATGGPDGPEIHFADIVT